MELLGKIVIGIGMVVAFLCLVLHLWGAHPWTWQAITGKEDDDRYYLGSHGRFLEVSRSTYQFCLWEEYAEMAAVGLVFSGFGLWALKKRGSNDHPA